MQEQLPLELQDLVNELIDEKVYNTFEEIVHDALWLMRDRHLLYKVKRDELRALLDVGIQQAERGEVAPLDMEAIKAKAALRLQQEQEQTNIKREELLALLEVGIQQAERGELVDGELAFARLYEKNRQRSHQTL